MTRSITIAELLQAGVTPEPHEAVAIAQQLIDSASSPIEAEPRPPSGPPTVANVYVGADGSVTCPSCDTTPAVSEIGLFLQTLLPANTPRLAGSLRYTIARALLDVEAPPFDSLADLSRALARHERGDRQEVVRGLLQRAVESRAKTVELSMMDRRRTAQSLADVRRQLREADARIYDQQRALDALITLASVKRPSRTRSVGVVAAGVAIGVALIGAGGLMRGDGVGAARPPAVTAPANLETSKTLPPPMLGVDAPVPTPANIVNPPKESKRAAPDRPRRPKAPTMRRTSSGREGVDAPRDRRASSPGILSRLRLKWLANKVAVRDNF